MDLRIIIFILIFAVFVSCQHYEDKRCRCICPSSAAVFNSYNLSSDWRQFIANVPPSKCNCDDMILPNVDKEVQARSQEYCLRCECKFESRNTAVIMVSVVFIVWCLSITVVYMFFMFCLNPLMTRRRQPRQYNDSVSDGANNSLLDAEAEDVV